MSKSEDKEAEIAILKAVIEDLKDQVKTLKKKLESKDKL